MDRQVECAFCGNLIVIDGTTVLHPWESPPEDQTDGQTR